MVIISLLDLPLDLPPQAEVKRHGLQTFLSGLSEYLSRCKSSMIMQPRVCVCVENVSGQTFEGGISGSPGTEAHGAYAFCALACLCIVGQPDAILE
jgi:protein farnesyltransferase subunit beta